MGLVFLPLLFAWSVAIPAGIVVGGLFALLYYRVFRGPQIPTKWIRMYQFAPLLLSFLWVFSIDWLVFAVSAPVFTIVSGGLALEFRPPFRRPSAPLVLFAVFVAVFFVKLLQIVRSLPPEHDIPWLGSTEKQ